jgi:hypothetical protein
MQFFMKLMSRQAFYAAIHCLAISLTLSGCVTTTPLHSDAPSATIKFDAPNSKLLWVFQNGANCTQLMKIDKENNPFINGTHLMRLPAGHPIALKLVALTGMGYMVETCSATFAMTLQPGGHYQLSTDFTTESCRLAVFDLSKDRSQQDFKLPLQKMGQSLNASTFLWGAAGEGCEPVKP